MNRIQLDDYQSIIKSNIKFEQFKNKVFLVTGGTGYLGSFLIKSLFFAIKFFDESVLGKSIGF